MPTVPAPAEKQSHRTPSAIAFSKFGTIGFDLYLATVLAEEERLAAVRIQKGKQ